MIHTTQYGFVFNGTKKEIITFWVLGFLGLSLAAHIILSVVVPLAIGNGVDKFSGIKHEIAQSAYDSAYGNIDNKLRWSYVIYVNDVYPTTKAEKATLCGADNWRAITTNDPKSSYYYTVKMTVRELFGYRTMVSTHPICMHSPGGFSDFGPEPLVDIPRQN